MTDSSSDADLDARNQAADVSTQKVENGNQKKSLSMHEGVAVWCDCCSCEAEPYWIEMMENPQLD